MKRLLVLLIFVVAPMAHGQSSGPNPPPPPVCSASIVGTLYTQTSTSPPTVYTCSYYNLQYQWVVNPSYGGLVYYPTVPSTCSGALPMFLAGYPQTQVYVCTNGVPTAITSEGTLSLTTTGTSGAASLSGGNLNIPQYQGALNLTTTGTSGAATLSGDTLNIPNYTAASNQALTINNSGTGGSSGTTYNGTAAETISYNTLGAAGVTGTPQSGNCVEWTSATTVGDTGAPCNAGSFAISGFSVSPTSAEIGQTVTNPTVAASYTLTPTSAAVTNTAGIGSPLTLTTPFTSGTVTGSFVENTQANVTFTLSAVYGGTKTATSAIAWLPRYFYGVGTPGATGATASGTSAVLTGATGTLASGGIGASQVGVTFPVVSPSGQKIYLLLIGTGHQFVDALTGFSMPFNSPTAVSFTNQYGDVVSMELYESTNLLSGNYQPKVTQ